MNRAALKARDERVVAQVPDEHPAQTAVGRIDADVAGEQGGLEGVAARRAGWVERVGLGAELADQKHLAGERPVHSRQPRPHQRDLLPHRRAGGVVPARVVGLRDGVHSPVQGARARRRVAAPHVDRHHARVVVGVKPARQRLHVAHLPAVAPVARHLVDEVPRHDRGMRRRVERGGLRLALGRAKQRRGARVPVPRAFDRSDALPHHDPGGVETFQQARVERVLGANGVGADRPQLAHEPVLVGGGERVAVAERVLL